MSTRTIGNYQVVATGTRGRTGVVHQARDIADGRPVELIELPGFGASDVSLWSAFEGVNTRLKSVRNKRLATSKTWSQSSENGAWYVTDPPRGISLEQFRESLQRVHWRQALMIIHEIAKALSFAHSRGVAHGNLSPMNVFVDIGGAVQIRRFTMLARIHLEVNDAALVSLPNLYDNIEYLSPEGHAQRSPSLSGDLFALGMIAYELIVGTPPFDDLAGLLAHIEGELAPPNPREAGVALPTPMSDLIVSMLQVRVDRRPNDIAAVAETLRVHLHALGVRDVGVSLGVELERQRSLFSTAPSSQSEPSTSQQERSSPHEAELSAEAEVLLAQMMASTRGAQRRERSMGRSALTVMLVASLLVGMLYMMLTQRDARRQTDAALRPTSTVSVEEPRAREIPKPIETLPQEQVAPAPHAEVATVLLAKGQASLESRQFARAERLAREALGVTGAKNAPAQLLLGRALEAQGEVDGAVAAYLASDAAEFGLTHGRLSAGFVLGSEGRCEEAIPHYRAAYRAGLDSQRLHTLLGSCELLVGALEVAVASLDTARRKGPDELDILMPLATALDMLGSLDRAREIYVRALQLSPGHGGAKSAIDRIDVLRADPDKAAKWLAARKETPNERDPQALSIEAFAAFTAGQFERAAGLYQQIVDLAGDAASAEQLKTLAIALDRAEAGGRATLALERAILLAPDDLELRYLVGRRLAQGGRPRDAIAQLKRAAESDEFRWGARFELGLAHLAIGDPAAAAVDFGALTAERPSDTRALRNLAKAQVEAGDNESALVSLERLSGLTPYAPEPWLTRAAILQRMDRREAADDLLKVGCSRGIQEACR